MTKARALLTMIAAAIAIAATMVSAAQAAPTFEVGLSHSPTVLPRSDKSVTYTLTGRNSAESSAANVGDQLLCNGVESLTPPSKNWFPGAPGDPTHPSYSFEWVRDGVVIGGETAQTYTATAADQGKVVQCLVRGANATGGAKYASLPGIVIKPSPTVAPPATSNRTAGDSRPLVDGTGSALRTCSTATLNWQEDLDGDPETAPTPLTGAFAFKWLRNGIEIPGAVSSTYTPAVATGNATRDGSTTLTAVTTSTGTFAVGDVITGTGIPAGTTIVSIGVGTIEISAAATAGSGAIAGGADNARQLQCQVTGTNAGGSLVGISNTSAVGTVPSPVNLGVAQNPEIELGNTTTGTITATLALPPGMVVYNASGTGWSCSSVVEGFATCTRSLGLAPQAAFPDIRVKAAILGEDPPDPAIATATVSGGGVAAAATVDDSLSFSPFVPFALVSGSFIARALDQAGDDFTQAGGHPHDGVTSFELTTHRRPDGSAGTFEEVGDIVTDLPAGFVGNPLAGPRCTMADALATRFVSQVCPAVTVVGSVDVTSPEVEKLADGSPGTVSGLPLYAVEPDRGAAAQFTFVLPTAAGMYQFALAATLKAENEYAVTVNAPKVGKNARLVGVEVRVCSYGANIEDGLVSVPNANGTAHVTGCKALGDPDALSRPVLTNQTSCPVDPPVTKLAVNSWLHPDVFDRAEAVAPPMTGCDQVPFTPAVSVEPTTAKADGASGLEADISIPDGGFNDPAGISQAHLKKTVVELPEGVTVNPAAATGLEACSDAQLGLGNDDQPVCPDASKIATVTATSPALEETLSGVMVLRAPESTDPESGEMLRMALIIRNDERGILVKLPGSATADSETGRLVATFDDNPQLPVSNVNVKLRGGDRGVLALPQDCGEIATATELSPWSGNPAVDSETVFDVDQDCSLGFGPKVEAGSSTSKARASGDFSFTFSREDGEQWIDGLTATLPTGLLASVRDVPLCSSADAEAGTCAAGSRIGTVDATAGSGSPFVLERKGDAYLTQGYRGCPYGLAVKVPVVAGPFDGSSPATDLGNIVVRQKVCVDRSTAQVSVTSDPLPTIWHGIPLRVRSVTVKVDRLGFMLNPSDCAQKQVAGNFHSTRGATADAQTPFKASDCAALPFEPKLALRLIGRRQVTTGTHPRVKAIVTQNGTSEAGIEKTVVRLPKSLALDPNNAQALCEFEDGTKPDLENHCPKGSIVGRARAKTPLLKDDLVGNVYFVKNVRRDPATGNVIRTLPMLIVALRGEIAVNLKGESSTTGGGKLVNTFANVPDAPISQFNLNIKGGQNGILAVTRTRKAKINLCASRQIAEVDNDGQNGRRHDTNVRIKTPCTKASRKAARNRGRS